MTAQQVTLPPTGRLSDSSYSDVRELAREILNAQTDAEFQEACRGMAACLRDMRPQEGSQEGKKGPAQGRAQTSSK